MSAASTFEEAWLRRREAPLAVGGDVVGYIGLDTPVELIQAAGLTPVRVVAEARSRGAEAFAEGLGNPVLRGLVSALVEGAYAGLARLIIAPTPAAYGWLYTFLAELRRAGEGPTIEVVRFDLNHGRQGDLEAVRRRTVEGLARSLEGWSGRLLDIEAAIAGSNATRKLLRSIDGLRAARTLSGVEALAVYGAAEAMAPGDYQAALRGLIAERAGTEALPGRAIVYSGVETVGPEVYAGLPLVVGDDQDIGSRSIGADIGHGDPYGALAQAYGARSSAPAKSGLDNRLTYLTGLVRAQGADGVVFNVSPYDHPSGWETPMLRQALAAQGIESEVYRG